MNLKGYLLCFILLSFFSLAGSETMKNVLLVCASFNGTTNEIAVRIKDVLEKEGCQVTLTTAKAESLNVTQYDFIVLGSAIHGDNPHSDILKFVDDNRIALKNKPVAVFAACATIASSKESRRNHALVYPDKVANGLNPVAKTVFAGNIKSAGWLVNLIGAWILGVKPGDYRDWNKIDAWSKSLVTIFAK